MRAETHVSRKLLHDVYEEKDCAALLQLLDIVREHLTQLCPACKEEAEAFSRRQERHQESNAPFLQRFETVSRALDAFCPRTEDETASIDALMSSLRSLPAEERWSVLVAAEGLHDRNLATALIEESRSCTPDEPAQALLWAQQADRLLRLLDSKARAADLQVLAIAYQANAHRLLGQLRAAEEAFSRSRLIVQSFEVADPAAIAELDSLQASLYVDLRRLDQAQHLLHRAAFLFKSIRADEQVGRVLIQLGIAYEHDADPVAALEITHEALTYLDPERHRHLFLCAVLSNARCHYSQGDYETALDVVAFDEDLIEVEIASGNTWLDYNLRWLRGRIAAAQGRLDEAERLLSSVRDEAVGRRAPYDAIVANTELAFIHYRHHRRDLALGLANEALALARAHRLPQHAIAALKVLTDTLRQGQPAAHLLHQATELIRLARWNPTAQMPFDLLVS